jgi:hypothetical protein
MTPDKMDELEINLAVRKEMDAREEAQTSADADPSLTCPWGIMGPKDYREKPFKTDKPD